MMLGNVVERVNALVSADRHLSGRGDPAHAVEIMSADRLLKKIEPAIADAAHKNERIVDGKALIGVGANQARFAALCLALELLTQHHRAYGVGLRRAQADLDLEGAIARVPARLRFVQIGCGVFRSDDREHRHAAARFGAEQSIDRPPAGAPHQIMQRHVDRGLGAAIAIELHVHGRGGAEADWGNHRRHDGGD